MATTVYGCVNLSTGAIDFEVCSPADFSGCIVTDGGEHNGQVKLITTSTGCDDTYYGCVNPTTGQFQLVIPDNCCCGIGVCEYCDPSPLYIWATFSDISVCEGCFSPNEWGSRKYTWHLPVNGTFKLTESYSVPCRYIFRACEESSIVTHENYGSSDCTGEHTTEEYPCREIIIRRYETSIRIDYNLYEDNTYSGSTMAVFQNIISFEGNCFTDVNNYYTNCPYTAPYGHAKNGTVSIYDCV